jgi:signal transduction histidine kinase
MTRLMALVESLLQYARVQSGKLVTSPRELELELIAADVADELAPQAAAKGLELRVVPLAHLARPLYSDPRILRLILVNLVANAIKYTEAGFVEVALDVEAGRHRLHVRDTGPGIPPDARVRIFEPFEQLGALKEKDQQRAGVGLGLALVKEMVAALGATIALESELGKGTTFTVTVPPLAREGGP